MVWTRNAQAKCSKKLCEQKLSCSLYQPETSQRLEFHYICAMFLREVFFSDLYEPSQDYVFCGSLLSVQ